jgi:hypothetical protein
VIAVGPFYELVVYVGADNSHYRASSAS